VQNGTGFNSAPFTLTVNNPRLSVSQPNGSGMNYGQVPAGSFSSQTLNFTNSGNLPLTIDSVTITGANPADFKFDPQNTSCPLQGGTLGPQQQCNAVILFEPLANATYAASVNFADEQIPGSPIVVPLTGTGVGQVSSTIAPTTLTFANQAVGTASQPQSLTITNSGTANGNIASVVLSDTSDFSTSNNCTSNLDNLSQGASCSIAITFHPTTAGNITASAVITSNQAVPYTIPLSGVGVVNFSLSAASGSSPSATVAAGQTATFQLTLAPQALTGSVALTCAPVTAIPNATCSVSPNPATVSGSSPTVIAVSVVTTAHSGLASPFAPTKGPTTALREFLAAHLVFYALALLGLTPASFKTWRVPSALATALLLITRAFGCGTSSTSSGGGSTGTGGTTSGNYQLVISATSAGATRTIMLSLTVQ
jgi:hypothetical protein